MAIDPKQLKPESLATDALNADPTVSSGQGMFFSKLVNSIPEAFFKNGSGHVIQLTSNGELIGGVANFEKSFVSGMGAPMSANSLVSVNTDGSIVLAESDLAQGQRPIGFLKDSIGWPANGTVILFGRNLTGVLTGYAFVPGDDIYMSETAGQLANDPAAFAHLGTDAIVRIGIACMGENQTGATATDLILIREVMSSP